jgi:uncharacterized protein YoxC
MYGPQAMDYLQQGVQGAQQMGGQLANQVGDLAQQASPYIDNVRQAAGQVAGNIQGQWGGAQQAVSSSMPNMSGAQQAIQDQVQTAGNLFDQYGRPLMQQAGNAISGLSPAAKSAALGGTLVGGGAIGAGVSALRGRKAQQAVPEVAQAVPEVAQAVPEVAQATTRPGLRQRAMSLASNPMARKLGLGAAAVGGIGAAGLGGKAIYDQMQGANYSHKVTNIATFCSNPANFR